MKLTADSGSTKTEWVLTEKDKAVHWHAETEGLNPFHLNKKQMLDILQPMVESMPNGGKTVCDVEFYGAGCALPNRQEIVRRVLESLLPAGCRIQVESDLKGAAKAVCQGEAGICCILGTGSNSCQFDGQEIVTSTPSLGYILGDEGSGATLGCTLLNHVLKNLLPKHLCKAFVEEYDISLSKVLDSIYSQPQAARYMAGFVPFLSKYREEPSIQELLAEEFEKFFQKNVIRAYDTTLPVHMVGSVAYVFKEELAKVTTSLGLITGRILRRPLETLLTT